MVRSLADRTFQLRPELPADAATIRRLLAVVEREILPLTRVEVAERGNKVFGGVDLRPPLHQLSRDPTNFRGLVLGCIEAKFCK